MHSTTWISCLLLISLAGCAGAPPRAPEHDDVVRVCERFLDDYSHRRWEAVEAACVPGALSVHVEVDGKRQQIGTLKRFLETAKPFLERDPSFVETIDGEPIVLVDDAIATVWARFRVSGAHGRGHGIDAFHLVKTRDGWRIAALLDTVRGER